MKIRKKLKNLFHLDGFFLSSFQSFPPRISSAVINYFFRLVWFGVVCFLFVCFCLVQTKKRYFSHHELFLVSFTQQIIIDMLPLLTWRCHFNLKKKTYFIFLEKNSHRCLAMGINANESPNVGANMVTSSLGLTVSNYYEDGFFVQLFENKFKLSMRHDQKLNIQYEHTICQPNQQPWIRKFWEKSWPIATCWFLLIDPNDRFVFLYFSPLISGFIAELAGWLGPLCCACAHTFTWN